MRRRVVITGIGCVTPLGTTVPELWKNLLAGKSGVGRTSIFDATNFPTKISAEVKNWSVADAGLDASEWADRSRHTCFAAGAANQAVRESGVLGTVEPTRFGVYLGAGEGSQDFFNFSQMMTAAVASGELDMKAFVDSGLKILDPKAELEQEPNMPVGYLAGMFDAQGPERELPHRVCREQPGRRRSDRNHPPRRSRRDALRRCAQHDSPLRRDGIQSAHGPE